MKLKNIFYLILIISVNIASAQPPEIVDSKIIWSENFFGIVWGDYIEEVTYSDGYVKNVMHRSQLFPGEIIDVLRITVSQADSIIPVKLTLQGMRCSLTPYSNHIVDFYVGMTTTSPIAHQTIGKIDCEQIKSYTVNVPAGSLLTNAGNFDMVMEETSYNAAATTFVTETRIFNVVVSPATPPPISTPATGTLKITSNPTGVSIRSDTKYMGETPITLNLPTGDYRIEASKSGYQTQTRTQSMYAGYSLEMVFSLTPTPIPTITIPTITQQPTTTPTSIPTSTHTTSLTTTPTATIPQYQYQCSNGDWVYDTSDCPVSAPAIPGFEAVFAIVGLLTVFLLRQKHEK